MGPISGHFGAMLEHLGSNFEHLTSNYDVKALILKKCQKCNTYRSFGTSERAEWLQVGAKLGYVGASWGDVGASWSHVGPSWSHVGASWELCWGIFGLS